MNVRRFTEFIKQHFSDTGSLKGVEVGVYEGYNALSMLEYLSPKLLVLVDSWNDGVDEVDNETHFLNTYKKFACNDSVIILRGMSEVLASLLVPESMDFVYIDANHCYLQTKDDIGAWQPIVRKGGVLGGHDYNMGGVQQAVGEWFEGYALPYTPINTSGLDWWIIK